MRSMEESQDSRSRAAREAEICWTGRQVQTGLVSPVEPVFMPKRNRLSGEKTGLHNDWYHFAAR